MNQTEFTSSSLKELSASIGDPEQTRTIDAMATTLEMAEGMTRLREADSPDITPEGHLTLDQGGEALLHVHQMDIDKLLDEHEGPLYIRQWLRITGNREGTIDIDMSPGAGLTPLEAMVALEEAVDASRRKLYPNDPDELLSVEHCDKLARLITLDDSATYASVIEAGLPRQSDGSEFPEFDAEAFMLEYDAETKTMADLEAACHPLMIEESELPVMIPTALGAYMGGTLEIMRAQGFWGSPRSISPRAEQGMNALCEASEKAYDDWEQQLAKDMERPVPLSQYLGAGNSDDPS